jgi:hypothetical protein
MVLSMGTRESLDSSAFATLFLLHPGVSITFRAFEDVQLTFAFAHLSLSKSF